MNLQELLDSSQKLYHATKIDYYEDQLKTDSIMAAMIHRYWKDGKRRERGDTAYEEHVWVKGVSLSRDLRFCLKWGLLVYELDKLKLQQRYKISPITWFMKRQGGSKRAESEEYLQVDVSDISGDGPRVIKYAEKDVRIKNWHSYCTRLIISNFFYSILPRDSRSEIMKNCEAYSKKYNIPLEIMDRSAKVVI